MVTTDLLVIDVGTSGVRAARVDESGTITHARHERLLPARPSPGVVEHDARAIATAALRLAESLIAEHGPVAALGIAAQRATTIVWDRPSGDPLGLAISWQDLRTTGMCLMLAQRGIKLAPNQSATKLAYLLDRYDRGRERDVCFGTIESYLAFVLSQGACHVTDATNAGVTGLVDDNVSTWDAEILEALAIPARCLPELVDSLGVIGKATALSGAPAIAALVGDQQASLIGQGCLGFGEAKATFGTGGMLDCSVGELRPSFARRGESGTFPIVTVQSSGARRWGLEAVMLSAGSCIDWCCQIGLLSHPEESDALAGSVRDAGSASFVPALSGLGTPRWDFGARGAFFGLDGAVGRAELVRAVLEGIAHGGADLLEAVESDAGLAVERLRVDGGMSANQTFLQLLADATGREIAPSAVLEATTLGAAFLAGVAVGVWGDLVEAAATTPPRTVVAPRRKLDRARWREVRTKAEGAIPMLSALSF